MITNRYKYASILFVLIASVMSLFCHGQNLYRFQNYTKKEGLPSPFVSELIQDSLGFIWINYGSGLARFDGYTFRTYTHDVEDTTRSPGKGSMGYFFEAGFDKIWLRPHGLKDSDLALTRYDSRKDRFVTFNIGVRDSTISRISGDDRDQNILWLGTYGEGICRVDLNSKDIEQFVVPQYNSFDKKRCNWVRGIWDCGTFLNVSTLDGMWRFDKQSKSFSRPRCSPSDTLLLYYSNISIQGTCPNGHAWLAIEERFNNNSPITYALVTQDLSIIKKSTILPEHAPPFSFFSGSHLDCGTSDVVWMVSTEGPTRYNFKDGSTEILRFPTPNPLAKAQVSSFAVDDQNNLWEGTFNGITKISKANLEFHNIPLKGIGAACIYTNPHTNKEFLVLSRFTKDIIMAPLEQSSVDTTKFQTLISFGGSIAVGKKMIWLAAAGEAVIGLPIDDKSGLPSKEPAVVYAHNDRNPNTISSFVPLRVWEDPDGNLWVTTKAQGLNKIVRSIPYGDEGSVIRYKHDPTNSNSLGNDDVYHVFPANDKSIWVITDTGIDLFHNALVETGTQRFEHVFENKTAPSDFVITSDSTMFVATIRGLYEANLKDKKYEFQKVREINNLEIASMMQDSLGRLWLFNYNGAVCFDRNKRSVTTFDEDDGILYTQVIGGMLNEIRTAAGTWILVDDEGLTSFDPLTFAIDESQIQPHLTHLTINNKEVRAGQAFDETNITVTADIAVLDELSLDYRHNNFSLEFSAMEMTDPEKNRYRHKLDGYDPEWIETDYKNRTATYTNLDAGTYTFRIKASNHHGVWSENERTLKVIILPPPWKTWWAYSIYTLIFLGLLFMARRMIVQRERLKGSLKLAKVEQEKEHFELQKAKEVDRVKTSFFTNISHEFRTPLTLIQGPVQDLLEEYSSNPKTQNKLQLVRRNSDLLLKLINQLLDLAKLDAGNLKIEKSKGEVMRFVKATGSSFSSLAAQKSISLDIDVPADPYYALFDRDKLETILINLINNAIKFTPPHGKVNVGAKVANGSLLLTVSDTGIGIPVDQQEKIFERFHQVSESHKEVGTGIGLALVKELVSLLEGTITVKSEVGKGSEFIVTLPLEIVSAEEHIEAHEQEISIDQPTVHVVQNKIALEGAVTNGEETRPHVLVVEDNADLRSFIIESLGEEFHFLEAENGKEGLHVATTEIPDLIISDVMMPEMDGITMAEKIKGDFRTNHIPLILLTAKSTEASKLTGLESGADDYLTKPFNKHELLLKIRNTISRQRKLREKVMAELMSDAPRKEVLSADEQFLSKVKEEILKQMSNEQLSVESLAEQIGMSRVHLYRKISGLTGMSVNELIRKLRLHRAAQLLEQRWGPVSQVAYEVGFSNLSYFSKVFKDEHGVLPSEYVEKI